MNKFKTSNEYRKQCIYFSISVSTLVSTIAATIRRVNITLTEPKGILVNIQIKIKNVYLGQLDCYVLQVLINPG